MNMSSSEHVLQETWSVMNGSVMKGSVMNVVCYECGRLLTLSIIYMGCNDCLCVERGLL